MINFKEPYNKFVIKLQESFLTLGSKKRIQLMLHYIDIRPNDVLLDVGGNIGKITEVYARRSETPRGVDVGTSANNTFLAANTPEPDFRIIFLKYLIWI